MSQIKKYIYVKQAIEKMINYYLIDDKKQQYIIKDNKYSIKLEIQHSMDFINTYNHITHTDRHNIKFLTPFFPKIDVVIWPGGLSKRSAYGRATHWSYHQLIWINHVNKSH